jgi:hypothetical protein
MKILLIGTLLALPPVAAWVLRGQEPPPQKTQDQSFTEIIKDQSVQIPIEVVTKGNASEWIYVEVPIQSVPEPGITLLIPLTSLLLLRRQRT